MSGRGRVTPFLHRSFLLRGCALWFSVRLALAMLGVVVLNPITAPILLVVVGSAFRIDQRVRREHLFLGNVGIHPARGPLTAMGVAAVLESIIQVILWSTIGG